MGVSSSRWMQAALEKGEWLWARRFIQLRATLGEDRQLSTVTAPPAAGE